MPFKSLALSRLWPRSCFLRLPTDLAQIVKRLRKDRRRTPPNGRRICPITKKESGPKPRAAAAKGLSSSGQNRPGWIVQEPWLKAIALDHRISARRARNRESMQGAPRQFQRPGKPWAAADRSHNPCLTHRDILSQCLAACLLLGTIQGPLPSPGRNSRNSQGGN